MPGRVSLSDLGRKLSLSADEVACLRAAGVRTADAAHNLLTASLTTPGEPLRGMDAARRHALTDALQPLISDPYAKALAAPAASSPTGAAAASAASVAQALQRRTPAQLQGHLQGRPDIDLVQERYDEWPVLHAQGRRQACVAFAVAACLELQRAGPGADFVPLSPQYLYWWMRTTPWASDPPPGWSEGATRLDHARQVLQADGFCRWEACPYDKQLAPGAPLEGPEPSLDAKAEGASQRVAHGTYVGHNTPGLARQLYDELAQGRPVAIALPVFAQAGTQVTNWSSGVTSGEITDPYIDNYTSFAGGHAVCVVAFQADAAEPSGGWFIFRNSVGGNWAHGITFGGDPPHVPARGFGALSASHVEGYCWELFSPVLP